MVPAVDREEWTLFFFFYVSHHPPYLPIDLNASFFCYSQFLGFNVGF
jgi:hypothetical protein